MAVETQFPDAIVEQTDCSGAVTDIDEDVDSPDANWCAALAFSSDPIVRVTFPTPTGPPTVGAGLQSFRVWARKSRNKGTTPTLEIQLYENGSLVRAGSPASVTNLSGEEFSFTWNASELGTSDGSLVECRVVCVHAGTGGGDYTSVDIGAVNWDVNYTPSTVYAYPSPAVATAAAVSPSVQLGAITVSPPTAVATSAGVSPTVQLTVTRVPGSAIATAAAITPVAALGGVTRAPPPAVATAAAVTPLAFIPGTWAYPDPAAATVTAVSPGVVLTYTAQPAPAVATSAAITPTATSDQFAWPAPAVATSAAVSPTVALGEVVASPSPAAATAAAVSPTVALGALAVSPEPAAATAAAISPAAAVPTLGWYNTGKGKSIDGSIDLLTGSVKVLLVGALYSFDPDHLVVNDVVASECSGTGYSRKTLTGRAINVDQVNDRAYLSADDVTWTGLDCNAVGGAILFLDTGNDATAPLIACAMFPIAIDPAGDTHRLRWNALGVVEVS